MRGGDENPPTIRSTGAQGDGGGEDKWMGGPKTTAPLRPQRDTAVDNGSAGTRTRHTASADSARPKHSALARRRYGLLAPTGAAVDPVNVGDPGIEDGHEATG